jgi:hypothetical protein
MARSADYCLLEAIMGSQAYGLATPHSDQDIRGVFIQPAEHFYGLHTLEQVNDEKQDTVFYELARFISLAGKNNPNILEMLFLPPELVLQRSPLFERFRPEWFLSKVCLESFGGYALAQIKKARGLNKKIVNPQPMQRRTVLDFCHTPHGQGTQPMALWLEARGLSQEQVGLVALPHIAEGYAVFTDPHGSLGLRGMLGSEQFTELRVSSVPKGLEPATWMVFNKDGFRKHCKDWLEYQTWVAERNPHRYESTLHHGQGYDAKNIMHTFRLLDLAAEIAQEGTLTVRAKNAAKLRAIRAGEFSYESLLKQAEERLLEVEALFEASSLPERPDWARIEQTLAEVRQEFYSK